LILGTAYAPDLLLTRHAYLQTCPAAVRPQKVCMIDIAVPRILDAELSTVPGITLHNMEAMEQIAQENYRRRQHVSGDAWKIVEEEVDRYRAARRIGRLAEPIKRMESRLEKVLNAEGELLEKMLQPQMMDQLQSLQRRLRQRLLHEIIQELKALT
jgi:glutamyl-tRNA reductase